MNEETKRIYSAFGYDVSKGLRRPNQVTDEEALTIAKIFNNQLQWEVYLREKGSNGQIGLKSNPPTNTDYALFWEWKPYV